MAAMAADHDQIDRMLDGCAENAFLGRGGIDHPQLVGISHTKTRGQSRQRRLRLPCSSLASGSSGSTGSSS